jgi:hypothetical protein
MDETIQKIHSDQHPLLIRFNQSAIFLSDPQALRAGGHHSIIPFVV